MDAQALGISCALLYCHPLPLGLLSVHTHPRSVSPLEWQLLNCDKRVMSEQPPTWGIG